VAPRTHGSGLFTRGQTQVLTLLTLGAARDEQRVDGLDLEESKRFMHHYKFPPFSVGETGFMRGPAGARSATGPWRNGRSSVDPQRGGVSVHHPPGLRDS